MFVTDLEFLKTPCQPVTSTKEANKIIAELWRVVRKIQARGLAANQIGIQKRICVVHGFKPVALVNPVITFSSMATEVLKEGCLSLPGIVVEVERPRFVEVMADNYKEPIKFDIEKLFVINGETRALRHFDSFSAQHEIDHLNGILITDYIKEEV